MRIFKGFIDYAMRCNHNFENTNFIFVAVLIYAIEQQIAQNSKLENTIFALCVILGTWEPHIALTIQNVRVIETNVTNNPIRFSLFSIALHDT